MDIVDQDLQRFVGGQLEIQSEGKIFRGEISAVKLLGGFTYLRIEYAWLAELDKATAEWHAVENKMENFRLELCHGNDIGPSADGGDSRVFLIYPGGVATFFPPNGSKLDRSRVVGT